MISVFSFCFTVTVIICCCKAFRQHNQKPNIVFLLADDLVSLNTDLLEYSHSLKSHRETVSPG